MPGPKVKLSYFYGRGRAQPIRMLLSIGNVTYENEMRKFDEEWKKVKPSKFPIFFLKLIHLLDIF